MTIKLVHERDICIGCGACAMLCPEFLQKLDKKCPSRNVRFAKFLIRTIGRNV